MIKTSLKRELHTGKLKKFNNCTEAGIIAPIITDYSSYDLALIASLGVTMDGSNKVSQWSDQSGKGNHFKQATSGNQTLYVANGINGLPSISSNASQWLKTDATISGIGSSSISAFYVVRITADAAASEIFETGTGLGDYGITRASGGILTTRNNQTYDISGAATMALNTNYLVTDIKTIGVSRKIYLNGTLYLTCAANQNTSFSESPNALFAFPDGSYCMTGLISEVRLKKTALSDVDRGDIETELKTKYGIS